MNSKIVDFFSLPDARSKDKIKKPNKVTAEDKHTATLEIIKELSKVSQKGLENLEINYNVDRKTKIVLCLLPEWDSNFPPYNLAKLAGAIKASGFFCKSFDLNAGAHHYYQNLDNKLDYYPWSPLRDFHWQNNLYFEELHPVLQPYFDKKIQEIVEISPDIVGFTLYYCNYEPSIYVANELKKFLPNVKFVVGGPHTHNSFFKSNNIFDYVVNGEGEKPLLDILEQIEQEKEVEFTDKNDNSFFIRQPENQRYNLSTLPSPDYSDFDFSLYKFPNGALCEISRGCIAKCTFCEETHFWKYRQRTALSTLEEIERMYYTYGTNVYWFIDSLVNGNLNELRAFCRAVHRKGLKIHWTGYARCDGRMDLEYYKDLKKGGCTVLNYGIESGSQKVLDKMDKKVTVEEMEANFRDGSAAGIGAMTNWIVGFPNERHIDFDNTLTFLYRIKDKGLLSIAQGTGFVVGVDTIVGQNFDKFDLLPYYYYDHWITKDFKASIAHKMVKNKLFSIFTDLIKTDEACAKPTRERLAQEHYRVDFLNPELEKEIQYTSKDFNYNIINSNIGPFQDSLMNEIWPFFHILWKIKGGYSFQLLFNIKLDQEGWGIRGSAPLNSLIKFDIDNNGKWKADCTFEYKQEDYNGWNDVKWKDHWGKEFCAPDPVGPVWKVTDFTRDTSNSAIRARKLAWRDDIKYDNRDPKNAFNEDEYTQLVQEFLNYRNINFSFNYEFKNNGKW